MIGDNTESVHESFCVTGTIGSMIANKTFGRIGQRSVMTLHRIGFLLITCDPVFCCQMISSFGHIWIWESRWSKSCLGSPAVRPGRRRRFGSTRHHGLAAHARMSGSLTNGNQRGATVSIQGQCAGRLPAGSKPCNTGNVPAWANSIAEHHHVWLGWHGRKHGGSELVIR